MAVFTTREARVLSDLNEDFLTAWVPDVLAGVDFAHLIQQPNAVSAPAAILRVPRPGRHPMRVPILGFDWQMRLYRVCEPARACADRALRPEVCGYRTGATADPGFGPEYARFRDFLAAGVGEHAWTGTADVRDFFASVSPEMVLQEFSSLCPAGDTSALALLLRDLRRCGIGGLPAGYADARLLANLLLVRVDAVVETPFTRWVDDYRLFGDSPSEIRNSVCRLQAELRALGLELNRGKARLLPRDEARRQFVGLDLASVYHPELEDSASTRSSLRRVFLDSIEDPIRSRRVVRFCLPRFAEQGDDFALEYALDGLLRTPWELPRLVSYLHAFRDREHVSSALLVNLRRAAETNNEWLMARLAPACAGLRLGDQTAASLFKYAKRTANAPLWGLAARLMALSGERVVFELARRNLDVRAALACYRDLETDPPADLVDRASTTASVLEETAAPAPSPLSLL